MRRALAVIMAIVVSILWLGMIVGVPALALTGTLWQFIPTNMIDEVSAQLGVDVTSLTDLTGIDLPAGVAIGEPAVELPTATPAPEEPTPEPPTETPTEEPTPTATATATTTPTPEAEPELDLTVTVTGTETLTDTGALTGTVGVTTTPAITVTEGVTPTAELTPIATVEAKRAIVASTANLRAGPGLDFEIVETLEPPVIISVVGQDATGEWFLIDDGTWIFGALLTEAPDVPVVDPSELSPEATAETPEGTPTPEATTTTPIGATQSVTRTTNADANLRSGPGTNFDVVVGAAFGTVVTVVGRVEAGDWYLLDDGNWIFAALLGDPITDVPVVDAEGNIISGINQGLNVLELQGTNNEETAIATPTPEAEASEVEIEAPSTPEPAEEETDTSGDTADGDVTTDPEDAATETAGEETSGQPTANAPANLRAGPGTEFDIVGSAEVGTALTLTGRNPAGDWYQLSDSTWIFATLVNDAPVDLPVVNP